MSETVLITGARSAAALDLARDFKRIGFQAHLADSSSSLISRFSCAPAQVHRYASPRHQPLAFANDIAVIVDRIKPSIIVPICEEIFYLATPNVSPAIRNLLFAPSFDVLQKLHAKDLFAAVCRDIGLLVPEIHNLTCSADLETFIAECTQWVFKPCYSRFGTQALIRPDAHKLLAVRPSKDTPWVAQRFIVGQEVSFYATAKQGKLTTFTAYTTSWRLVGGASYAFDPLSGVIVTNLKLLAERLAKALNVTGQIACDAIIDGEDRIWLIECNPRATSGIHLLTGSGTLAKSIIYGTDNLDTSCAESCYLLPALFIFGLPEAIKKRKWRNWWQQLQSGRDVIGRAGDRSPILGALLDSVLFLFYAYRNHQSMRAATTLDIEWNGENLI